MAPSQIRASKMPTAQEVTEFLNYQMGTMAAGLKEVVGQASFPNAPYAVPGDSLRTNDLPSSSTALSSSAAITASGVSALGEGEHSNTGADPPTTDEDPQNITWRMIQFDIKRMTVCLNVIYYRYHCCSRQMMELVIIPKIIPRRTILYQFIEKALCNFIMSLEMSIIYLYKKQVQQLLQKDVGNLEGTPGTGLTQLMEEYDGNPLTMVKATNPFISDVIDFDTMYSSDSRAAKQWQKFNREVYRATCKKMYNMKLEDQNEASLGPLFHEMPTRALFKKKFKLGTTAEVPVQKIWNGTMLQKPSQVLKKWFPTRGFPVCEHLATSWEESPSQIAGREWATATAPGWTAKKWADPSATEEAIVTATD